ncbi:DNA polymerase III PolC-type [compost metagenome]
MLPTETRVPENPLSGTFVVLDLETTGLDYKLDRILEIGAVKLVDGAIADKFQALVDPETPMREENIAIHGITPAMVADAPAIAEVLPRFFAWAGDAPWVAHNALFDVNFLQHNAALLGLPVPDVAVIDTLDMGKEVFPSERKPSLERLLELLDEPARDLHRALVDAEALASIFPTLWELRRQKRSWHTAQFERITQIGMRYRQVQTLLSGLQEEYKELRRTLELYFEETGALELPIPDGGILAHRRESWEFHSEEVREALAKLGILDRVLRVDREKVDRWLKSDRLSDEERDSLLATRRFLGAKLSISVEPRGRHGLE